MIPPELYFLYFLNFLFLFLLSRLFFERGGKWTFPRFLSLLPFMIDVGFLACASLGIVHPAFALDALLSHGLEGGAVLLSVSSFILVSYAIGGHRKSVPLCHQPHDRPTHLVVEGAYRKVRHPLYTAHLLLLFGVFVLVPHWISFLTFVYGVLMLVFTARKEEEQFLSSEFGNEYQTYMEKTGRFLPRWK